MFKYDYDLKWLFFKKVYVELLNLSVEMMNLIAEDVIDILEHQSNLSSPHRSIFVIDSSCFLKCFHQFF